MKSKSKKKKKDNIIEHQYMYEMKQDDVVLCMGNKQLPSALTTIPAKESEREKAYL